MRITVHPFSLGSASIARFRAFVSPCMSPDASAQENGAAVANQSKLEL